MKSLKILHFLSGVAGTAVCDEEGKVEARPSPSNIPRLKVFFFTKIKLFKQFSQNGWLKMVKFVSPSTLNLFNFLLKMSLG